MQKIDTRQITLAAVIAAAYAALTLLLPGLSYGPLQIRFSEALTVLPFLFPAAVPGVFLGCLIANLISPYGLPDLICGSAATLLAALCTAKIKNKWLAPLPPVLFNGLIIGAMLAFYAAPDLSPAFWAAFATNGTSVALGELIPCYALGVPLLIVLPKIRYFRTMSDSCFRS